MVDNVKLVTLDEKNLDECVDLFMATFSKAPWFDVYESRQQVVDFFENHLRNNYFLGYALLENQRVVAISLGFKKPWIKGMEYYIDEFCVGIDNQSKGLGSEFLRLIEADIEQKGLNAIFLITEKGVPAEKFYLKNGFSVHGELIVLSK